MSKVSPLQGNFNTGEVSPLLMGRVDQDRYKSALSTCLNYIPTIQGGLVRRSGTQFIAEIQNSSQYSRLIRFEFSVTQAYMLEFSDHSIRFYMDYGLITFPSLTITNITRANPAVVTTSAPHGLLSGTQIQIANVNGMTQVNNRQFTVTNLSSTTFSLSTIMTGNVNSSGYVVYASGGTVSEIYSIISPYDQLDLFELKFTQSADVLYITHPAYAPQKLSRTGNTSWTIVPINFLDGPYLNINTTATTLTPGAATGASVTLTASSIIGINDDAGFVAGDVGRLIRMLDGTVWGYAVINSVSSSTVVVVKVINTLTTTSAKSIWRLGVWSTNTGFPTCVIFFQDRLFFAGAPAYPERLDGSKSGDYENFAPSNLAGTVAANDAVSFTLNSDDVQAIQWMTSDQQGLVVGTLTGEWLVTGASGIALSATSINAVQSSTFGSSSIQPLRVDKATLFAQRSNRKLMESVYYWQSAGYNSQDVTQLSEHIMFSGMVEMAYQRAPQSIVWCIRNDGVLCSMTYERTIEALSVGWARHIVGGVSDAAGSPALIESVEVIPSPDGTKDDVWLIVQRHINGIQRRFIEYITPLFNQEFLQRDAFFVDAGLSYDNPIRITVVTKANPAVVTTASPHGFSNGDTVLILGAVGMSDLNTNTFTVAGVTSTTFQLSGLDSTAFTAYISSGYVRKMISNIYNLNHLEGETVSVLADGAVQVDTVVTNGAIALTVPAATVQIGYSYPSDGQQLRLEAGAKDGTALGKKRRTHHVGFLVYRSLGLEIGLNFDELTTLTFRTSTDPMSRAPALFSGIISETLDADYDYENQVCWRQAQPLPSIILALMPQLVTQDNG